MGNVLHVELPVGLDEQQMQAMLSTPDLRKRQPVSAKLGTKRLSLTRLCPGVGRLASRTIAAANGVQCRDSPPLVDLGVSHPLRAHIGVRNLADHDQSSDLVAEGFFAPGKSTSVVAQY